MVAVRDERQRFRRYGGYLFPAVGQYRAILVLTLQCELTNPVFKIGLKKMDDAENLVSMK